MKKWKYVILIGIIVVITAPILLMAFYTVPYNDDFATIGDVVQKMHDSGRGITYSAFLLTLGRFKTWGGFYTGSFFNYAINPYMRWGIAGHQITLFFINLFFIVSVLLFVLVILKQIFGIKSLCQRLVVGIGMLVCFLDLYYYTETNYWYCTAVSYVLIVAFMLWGVICDVLYMNTGKKRYAVLAILMGFLTSGGALNLVALNCEMALLLAGYEWLHKKGKRSWLYFASSLIGGLINACAPGNFVRNNETVGFARVTEAIGLSAEHFIQRVYYLLKYTPFLLILAILFFFMLKYVTIENIKIKFLHLVLLSVLIAAGGTVIAFPVILGYGANYYPDRCLYIDDCFIYIGTFLFLLLFVQWCKELTEQRKRIICFVIPVVMCAWIAVRFNSLENAVKINLTVKCIREVSDGTAQHYFSYWNSLLKEIQNAEEENVVVVRKNEEHESSILQGISLTSDTDNWVNKAVAACYGKEDVQYIMAE